MTLEQRLETAEARIAQLEQRLNNMGASTPYVPSQWFAVPSNPGWPYTITCAGGSITVDSSKLTCNGALDV